MFPISVFISGNGSNLQAIIEKCHNPGYVKIINVVSDNNKAYGITRVKQADTSIPPFVMEQGRMSRQEYCRKLMKAMQVTEPKLIVLAGFMKVLTPEFTNAFHRKIINIHPALLPKHKGGGPSFNSHRNVLQWGEKEHGITIHWVNEELDGGPIILQRRFPVMSDDTEETLEKKVHNLEHIWYPWVINRIAEGYIT